MVGPLLLLKMIHCKRTKDTKAKSTEDCQKSAARVTLRGSSSSKINTATKIEENAHICRVCLQEGSLPIYGKEMEEDISEELILFASIDIKIDDPHPKFLCQQCRSHLHIAILFRKTAQKSDEILKKSNTDDLADYNSNQNYDVDSDCLPVQHKEQKVKILEVHVCRKCNISFNSFEEYMDHTMTDEHENKKHVCPYCQKSYNPLYLKKHITLHTETAGYVCDICGKRFKLQARLVRHRHTHSYNLPYKCSLCPYRGRFSESLKLHMRTHTGEKPYACTECSSGFTNKSNLNKHLLTHKAKPDFKCDTCRKCYHTKRELDLHYKVVHIGIMEHICKTCGIAFGYRRQLAKHETNVHKRAKLKSGRTPLYLKVLSMEQKGEENTLAKS